MHQYNCTIDHRSQPSIPPEFYRADLETLNSFVKYHRRMADLFEKRAQRQIEIIKVEKRTDAKIKHLQKVPSCVLRYLELGYNSIDSAMDATARELQISIECVQSRWKAHMKRKSREERQRRDITIKHLHHAGCTNAQIAQRMGVHRNTISRALNRKAGL